MHRAARLRRVFGIEAIISARELDAVHSQSILADTDLYLRTVHHPAFEDELGKTILKATLDHAFQRTCAIDRIVAGVRQPGARLGIEDNLDLAVRDEPFKTPDLDLNDLVHVLAAQAMEQDDLVETVEEFGTKVRTHR